MGDTTGALQLHTATVDPNAAAAASSASAFLEVTGGKLVGAGVESCPAGTVQTAATPKSCEPCPAGKYCNGTAAAGCPIGTHQALLGAASAAACMPCGGGKSTLKAGSTACQVCDLGFAANGTDSAGKLTCKACAAGSFTAEKGSASCRLCPARTYTNLPGQAACLSCPTLDASECRCSALARRRRCSRRIRPPPLRFGGATLHSTLALPCYCSHQGLQGLRGAVPAPPALLPRRLGLQRRDRQVCTVRAGRVPAEGGPGGLLAVPPRHLPGPQGQDVVQAVPSQVLHELPWPRLLQVVPGRATG